MNYQALIEALAWDPIGSESTPLDVQLQIVQVIRHAAISYPELEIEVSRLRSEIVELNDQLDIARNAAAIARNALERIQL
jgi:hypothetical protein